MVSSSAVMWSFCMIVAEVHVPGDENHLDSRCMPE